MTDPNKPSNEQSAADEWERALAEQSAEESAEDLWGAAMAEQSAAESEPAAGAAVNASSAGDQVFKPLQSEGSREAPRELDMIMEIPVTLSVELGRTRLTIRELLDLAKGSVVELDGLAGEPMDILINGYLIAQGEVVVVDDKYGIRITDIITPSERIHKLNR